MRRSDIERSTRRLIPFVTLGGALLCGIGLALLQLSTQSLTVSFTSLFLILVGSALFTPLALVAMMRVATPVSHRLFGVLGRMAPRAVIRSLSRTSVAVAALTLSISVIVGVGVMINSFRSTVTDWMNVSLGADVFISPAIQGTSREVDPALLDSLRIVDGVIRVTSVRSVHVIAPDYPDLPPVNLVVPSDDITHHLRRFAWLKAPDDDYWQALVAGEIVVSEPFAHRRKITAHHNTLTLLTDQGSRTFTVAGVFYDYTTDQGTVLMYDGVYRQVYDDPYISAAALDLSAGSDVTTVVDRIQSQVLAGTGLRAQSNRTLRLSVLDVFDRTFSITIALRLLAATVAFIGILSALLSLQLEHTRQYGIMRANGMTPGQLRLFTFIQTGLMGTVAGLLSLPIGLVLALILIYVINVRSFGWTMQLALSPQLFLQAFAVALIASLTAGIYPAWRLSKLVAARALRSE
jgi:putative ABC transport system permease protein